MKTIFNITTTYSAIFILLTSCGNNHSNYDASGVFETTEVLVSSQAGGQIMQLNIEEGQVLEAEKPVGYIDTTQLYLKKMQLLSNIKTAANRHLTIDKQIASLKQQIVHQKSEQQRFDNLVKSNAANQKQLDDINAQLTILEKQLAAQVETLENNNKIVAGERVSLEIQIAQIEDQIQKSIISSPITGTVLSKYAEQGELTAQGKAVFKIAAINNMFLRAYITSDQITQLKIGEEVKVYADFGKKEMREYAGTVTWISEKAEFTPKTIQTRNERANLVYAVKIAVKNDGYLKKGMYGEVKLKIEKENDETKK